MKDSRTLFPILALGAILLTACVNDSPTGPEATAEPAIATAEAAVGGDGWLTRATMPKSSTAPAVVTLRNAAGQSIVHAIGGLDPDGRRVPLNTVTAYNVATNTWKFRFPLPVPLAGTSGAGVIDGKIYVTGGYSDSGGYFPWKTVYMYDPATNRWTRKREMPSIELGWYEHYPSGEGVTGVIGGRLYVLSAAFTAEPPVGYFESGHALFFRYNAATDRWTTLPPPFAGIVTASPYVGGVIGGKFYVMAGSSYTHDSYFAVYDPATNQWTARKSLGLSRPGAATAVLDGKLFVMGGRRHNATLDGWNILDKTTVYDPATNAWTDRAPMPTRRANISAAKVFLDGRPRIEVVGGTAPGNNLQYVP